MKLVFTADTHFGSKFKDGDAAARTAEHIACFSAMADKARALGAPLLIGGDLFDTPFPSAETEAAVRRVFETHSDVRFYAVAGNHDPLDATAFYADPPENLHVFPDRVECVELGGVSLYGVSMGDAFGGGDPWRGVRTDGRAVTLSHAAFAEGGCYTVNKTSLSETGALLHLMGHIHKTASFPLPGGGAALYAGSPFGRGFDECGRRGYYVIDTDTLQTEYVFTDAAVYAQYEADVSDVSSYAELFSRLSRITPAEGEIARIVLTGSTATPVEFDGASLAAHLGVVAVKDETTADLGRFSARTDNTLEGEFTRIILEKMKNAPESERDELSEALKEGVRALRSGK